MLCTPPSELTTYFIREIDTLHACLLTGVAVTKMISGEPDYSYCSTQLELAPSSVFYYTLIPSDELSYYPEVNGTAY